MSPESTLGNPAAVAVELAATLSASGPKLDFSLDSLKTEIDRALDLPIFFRGRDGSSTDLEERSQAALSAYIGETLRRLFRGEWGGEFHVTSDARNYYTSFITFGDYRYWPSHYIGYRLANWPGEGTFAQHLERALPVIEAALRK